MTGIRATATPNAARRHERKSTDEREGRRNPVLWVTAAGLFLGGAGLTALSLLLPSEQTEGFDPTVPRVASAALGVLLTSLGGVLGSHLTTQASALRDAQTQHLRFLTSTARSLATIYLALQDATTKRRTGAFSHEETYQEAILMSANSVLTEYDNITSLSGRIQGAFRDSKTDLEEIRSVFAGTQTLLVATPLAAEQSATVYQKAEPVIVACPICGSRVSATLALRAGWTGSAKCTHCGTSFLIHRRADLAVYVGRVNRMGPGLAATTATAGPNDEGSAPHSSGDEAPVSDAERTITVACPECNFESRVQVGDRATTVRICIQCASINTISSVEKRVIDRKANDFISRDVVGRKASHPKVTCDVDEHELVASFERERDGAWIAVCTVHSRCFAVDRSAFRAWLEVHDPVFLATRLDHERRGGVRRLSDLA